MQWFGSHHRSPTGMPARRVCPSGDLRFVTPAIGATSAVPTV